MMSVKRTEIVTEYSMKTSVCDRLVIDYLAVAY